MSNSKKIRIAIVDADSCQPTKCKQECKRVCPVNKVGKECVSIERRMVNGKTKDVSQIVESSCVGCGICVSKCPYSAIQIINLPSGLNEIIYKYGANSFQLHNLPMPKRGSVLGLIGANGVGKTTSLQILCNHVKPNFGKDEASLDKEIIKYYRGSLLQNYFQELYKNKLTISVKSQNISFDPSVSGQNVKTYLETNNEQSPEDYSFIKDKLCLNELETKTIGTLSGGQKQRLLIAIALLKNADVYVFDEPSSFLDIKQRLNMGSLIREFLIKKNKYIIVVEHDMSVLDYLSDQVCLLYGQSGAYGIASAPYSVGEGINMYLDGYISAENMRFRTEGLNFKFGERISVQEKSSNDSTDVVYSETEISYPELRKNFENFELIVDGGVVKSSEITVLLGENGTGKTTFIKMLCGMLKPDGDQVVPLLNVSYKPQLIEPKFEGTIRELFSQKIGDFFNNQQFRSDVIAPLKIDHILNNLVKTCSGGELQRISIILALGKPADIYLIDEPSAYLDIEQRLVVAKVIKKFIMNSHKYCFVVEHDFIMSSYLANRVIVFSKSNQTQNVASAPLASTEGFNNFLKLVSVTFRRDMNTYRPRINKLDSQNDQIQKASGNYFFSDLFVQKERSQIVPNTNNLDW